MEPSSETTSSKYSSSFSSKLSSQISAVATLPCLFSFPTFVRTKQFASKEWLQKSIRGAFHLLFLSSANIRLCQKLLIRDSSLFSFSSSPQHPFTNARWSLRLLINRSLSVISFTHLSISSSSMYIPGTLGASFGKLFSQTSCRFLSFSSNTNRFANGFDQE